MLIQINHIKLGEKKLTETRNNDCINIVKKSSESNLVNVAMVNGVIKNDATIHIMEARKNHPVL